MYIDQIEIDRVKQSHDLVEVIRSYGVELKPKGKQFVGRCIFHKDKTPSLFVDPIKQLWNCLGACHGGGDIYKWVMKKEGISFIEAHKKLGGNTINTISAPAAGVIAMQWLERAVSHYQKRLLENPSAQRYLKFRGLAHSSLVAAFQIGFADGSLMETLSPEGKEALTNIGVITKSGRELMQGCVIFPLVAEEQLPHGTYP